MRRVMLCVGLAAMLAGATGCMSRAAKESLGLAGGAKGVVVPIREVSANQKARPLGEFENFELEPFADQSGLGVPAIIQDTLETAFAQALTEKKLPREAGGKTLTVRGTYVYYEDSSSALDQVFGPFEELIARVQLVDGKEVLGEAYCLGRSKTSINQGPEKKAEGLAKAIVKWIDRRYPER